MLAFLLMSCTREQAPGLVLISPHSDEIQNEFEAAFKRYYRGEGGREISLEWLDVGGGTSSILRYIKSEFGRRPEGIGVDVFFGGGLDPYAELAELELCSPYRLPDALLSRLPEVIGGVPLYDPDYRWYGATLSGFGIVYNRRILDEHNFPVPKTWADLGDPRFATWVGSGDPRTSGSVHMVYELILQAYGWERGWEVITTLGANVRHFGSGGAQAPRDVAVGEVAYGLSIDFYALAQVAKVGEKFIGFTMPDNLTIVNPDGLAILKGAPNIEAAQAFVRFVMSASGQKLWFLKKGTPGGPHRDPVESVYGAARPLRPVSERGGGVAEPLSVDLQSDLRFEDGLGPLERVERPGRGAGYRFSPPASAGLEAGDGSGGDTGGDQTPVGGAHFRGGVPEVGRTVARCKAAQPDAGCVDGVCPKEIRRPPPKPLPSGAGRSDVLLPAGDCRGDGALPLANAVSSLL